MLTTHAGKTYRSFVSISFTPKIHVSDCLGSATLGPTHQPYFYNKMGLFFFSTINYSLPGFPSLQVISSHVWNFPFSFWTKSTWNILTFYYLWQSLHNPFIEMEPARWAPGYFKKEKGTLLFSFITCSEFMRQRMEEKNPVICSPKTLWVCQ